MQNYKNLLRRILAEGEASDDRTGTGIIKIFGEQLKFDLSKGFPLMTTKKVHLKSIIHELIWFLNGDTNLRYLAQNGVHIWDDWTYEKYKNSPEFQNETIREFSEKVAQSYEFAQKWGDLGPIYGQQWRRWEGKNGKTIDQIQLAVDQIKNNPTSRRILVSGWNIADIEELVHSKTSAPPPCHTLFQFDVTPSGKLNCQLYQRSADVFLGVPFNIASYSLLTLMMAQVTGLKPGTFVHTFGNVHIYKNHLEQVNLQLERPCGELPTMTINPVVKNIFDFTYEDFKLENYNPWPAIKAPVAV